MSNLVALTPTEQQVIEVFRQALEEAKNHQLSPIQTDKLRQFAKLHEELLRKNGDLLLQQRKLIEELDKISVHSVDKSNNNHVSLPLKQIEVWNREAIKKLPPGERGTFAIARDQTISSSSHWESPSVSKMQNTSKPDSKSESKFESKPLPKPVPKSAPVQQPIQSKSVPQEKKEQSQTLKPEAPSSVRANQSLSTQIAPSQPRSSTPLQTQQTKPSTPTIIKPTNTQFSAPQSTQSSQSTPKPQIPQQPQSSVQRPSVPTPSISQNLQAKPNPESQRQPNIKYPLLTTKFTNSLRSKI